MKNTITKCQLKNSLNIQKGFTKMTKAIEKKNETAISASDTAFNIPTGFVNTFDLATDEGKKSVLKAYNAAESLNNHMDEVLHICDVMTTPGIRKGRNGMPDVECQNTYLIDTNGVSYFTQSDGVKRSLNLFVALYPDFGKSSEKGCIDLKCIEQELGNGNSLKTLIPA